MLTNSNLLPAIHIADNDGVTYVNVYRRSLSSGLNHFENPVCTKHSSDRDPQGLRRPRFSFFIFTCQTARGAKPHFHHWKVVKTSSDDK